MLKWIPVVLGVLIGLLLAVTLVGALLPRDHRATASIALDHPADSVWNVVRNLGGYAEWRDRAEAVKRLSDRDGRETWAQQDRRGESLPIEVVEAQAPRRLVTRIADESLPFGGT